MPTALVIPAQFNYTRQTKRWLLLLAIIPLGLRELCKNTTTLNPPGGGTSPRPDLAPAVSLPASTLHAPPQLYCPPGSRAPERPPEAAPRRHPHQPPAGRQSPARAPRSRHRNRAGYPSGWRVPAPALIWRPLSVCQPQPSTPRRVEIVTRYQQYSHVWGN